MLRSSKQLAVTGGLVAVCLIGIAVLLLAAKRRSARYAESHGIARTRMDIQDAFLAIKVYIRESGSLPEPLASRKTAKVDTKWLYSSLFADAAVKFSVGPPARHWEESQDLVDRWGNAFNILVQPDGGASFFRIRIWSSGPNGKDEAGTGDDIKSEDIRVEVGAKKN